MLEIECGECYDGFGLVSSVGTVRGSTLALNVTQNVRTFVHTVRGLESAVATTDGPFGSIALNFVPDSIGHLYRETSSLFSGAPVTFPSRDSEGRPLSIQVAGSTIDRTYDPLGRLLSSAAAGASILSADYSGYGPTTLGHGNGLSTTFTYDEELRLVSSLLRQGAQNRHAQSIVWGTDGTVPGSTSRSERRRRAQTSSAG